MPPRPPSACSRISGAQIGDDRSDAGRELAGEQEPRTATPSAPPSSRVVSFVAEPIPARSRGTAAISCVVIGVIVIAIPLARMQITTSITQYAVSTSKKSDVPSIPVAPG